jgi:hypothetical protein
MKFSDAELFLVLCSGFIVIDHLREMNRIVGTHGVRPFINHTFYNPSGGESIVETLQVRILKPRRGVSYVLHEGILDMLHTILL